MPNTIPCLPMRAECLGEQLPTEPGGPPGPKELGLPHPAMAVVSPANKCVQLKQGYCSVASSQMRSFLRPQEGVQAAL